jgi:hypothetical protein
MTWQPIETAPRDGTSVLLAYFTGDNELGMAVGYFDRGHDHNWLLPDWGNLIPDVLFWQPLPAPPAAMEDER